MRIRGAVLETIGAPRPYASSRPITVGDLQLDPPGGDEVLVRMEAAGICHSDLSVVDGNRRRPVPMLLGHEACGRVVERGALVEDLRPGDRVVMTFLPRCEDCVGCASGGIRPCIAGSAANEEGGLLSGGRRLHRDGHQVHHHLGVSGFADHAVVDRRSVVRVDDDVPADIAAVLGCAVLTGGGAVLNAGRPEPGQTVAVVGLGGVGMAALLTACGMDDITVIGIDAAEDKLLAATRVGAAEVYLPEQALQAGIAADVVIEAAGHAGAFETAVQLTGPGGRAVTVGLPPPQARSAISPLWLVAGGRTLIGSYLGSAVPARDIPRFAAMWRAGRLPVQELISGTLDLADINLGMDRLADGAALRQIITFDAQHTGAAAAGAQA